MLLGNRPRPPTRRTTSSTEFLAGVLLDIELPQLPDPEGSIGGEAIDPHLGVAQGSIAGVGVDWRAARFLGSMLSPRGGMQRELFVSPETVGFLRACGLCNRRLGPGRDAFMYRHSASLRSNGSAACYDSFLEKDHDCHLEDNTYGA